MTSYLNLLILCGSFGLVGDLERICGVWEGGGDIVRLVYDISLTSR